jgi:hypothetical protein
MKNYESDANGGTLRAISQEVGPLEVAAAQGRAVVRRAVVVHFPLDVGGRTSEEGAGGTLMRFADEGGGSRTVSLDQETI